MNWHDLANVIPFVSLTVNGKGKDYRRAPAITRLTEAAIIAAGTAFGTYQALAVKVDGIEDFVRLSVSEIKSDIKDMRRDLYRPR